ncbi:uncharacterized protein LOC111691874 [Anoplophora glabripennis]|uniref:uncharacterized protein LOC111691874 n=1 Tax=Anoplophora glabripennis TaxID=217634 RepID=UPI000C760510|nr:uncharacterized protein LOC111691874 [Anoplophora glabripennis]
MWKVLFASAVFFNLSQAAPIDATVENFAIADHFQEIISVIPKDLIKNITYEHLKTDEAFKSAVQFMQTDEWNNRVKIIREKPEWIALKKYMTGFGIHIDKFIKCADGFLQNVTVKLDPMHPPSKKSVRAFLTDIERNLPIAKILSIIHEKMVKNSELQQLFEKMSSDDTRKMIDNVLALSEIRSMLKDLAEMDMDITEMLSLIYAFLGWGELKLQ